MSPRSPLAAPTVTQVSFHPTIVAAHRRGSLMGALPGVFGVVAAPFYIASFGITLPDVVLFLAMYWATYGVGLASGFHRHFSHRAFQAVRPLRWAMAVLGSMAGQGSLAYWVAVHRRHHELSDQVGDPHSPNLHGPLSGLWHGHFGWSLSYGLPNATRYCPDIVRDRMLMAVSRQYRRWFVLGLLLPTGIGYLWGGSLQAAAGGLLFGGCLRLFVSSNSTWALNSICHRFGSCPHETRDQSGNVAWLALPTMGESWHNNHHAFPSSAAHGLRWWQLDLNYGFIRGMELLGLAHQVVRRRTGGENTL